MLGYMCMCLVFQCLRVLDHGTALEWVCGWKKVDKVCFSPLRQQLLAFFSLSCELISSHWVNIHVRDSLCSFLSMRLTLSFSSILCVRPLHISSLLYLGRHVCSFLMKMEEGWKGDLVPTTKVNTKTSTINNNVSKWHWSPQWNSLFLKIYQGDQSTGRAGRVSSEFVGIRYLANGHFRRACARGYGTYKSHEHETSS